MAAVKPASVSSTTAAEQAAVTAGERDTDGADHRADECQPRYQEQQLRAAGAAAGQVYLLQLQRLQQLRADAARQQPLRPEFAIEALQQRHRGAHCRLRAVGGLVEDHVEPDRLAGGEALREVVRDHHHGVLQPARAQLVAILRRRVAHRGALSLQVVDQRRRGGGVGDHDFAAGGAFLGARHETRDQQHRHRAGEQRAGQHYQPRAAVAQSVLQFLAEHDQRRPHDAAPPTVAPG
jgi:hypothetical protein